MIDNLSYFRRTIVRQVLLFLSFLSGISVSISVIVWIRLLKFAFGNVYFVTHSVIITFVLGLIFGSYYFGEKIDRTRNELQMFMKLEFIMGIYFLSLLIIFPLLKFLYKFIFLHAEGQTAILFIFTFLATFLALIVPSILFGATFPILSRFFIQSPNRVSRDIGNLYGVISLGAVVGCYLSGFVSLQIFGVNNTLIFAALLTLFVSGIVRFLLKKIEPTIYLETEFYDQKLKYFAPVTIAESNPLKSTLVAGMITSGFLVISYLILWSKSFIYVAGNNTYSNHIILIIFFAGISIGAIIYPRFFEKGYLITRFAIIEIIIGLLAIISLLLIPQLHEINDTLLGILNNPAKWGWRAILYFYDATIFLILPAILMGMTIPMGCKIYLSNLEERGKKIGFIYAANAFGIILGLNATAYVLLPNVGIQKSIIFLALINFSLGLIILFLATFRYGNIVKTSMVFGLVAVIFAASIFIPPNLLIRCFEKKQNGNKLLYVKEGIDETISIHRDALHNNLTLVTNGATIAGTSKDWVAIQRFHGHLPLLLHSRPDTILSIGFRDGETLRSILLHSVKKLDCLADSPEVIKASSLINGKRYDLISNPALHVILADRTIYISSLPGKYDVILNDIAHPAFIGSENMFTLEHFRACQKELKPGGIMSCVIPLFKISVEDFKILIATFRSVFPVTTLWYNNNSLNRWAILIGSVDPGFKFNYSQIWDRINEPDILVDLTDISMDNVYEFLDSFMMGPGIIKELTEGVRLNRNNLPHLEFSTPKMPDTPLNWNQTLQLLANYREPVFPYLVNIDSTLEQREFVRLVMQNYHQSTELVFSALGYQLMGQQQKALHVYRQVYMMNRFDRGAKSYLDSYYDPQLIVYPQTPADLIHNATVYYQKMEYELAISLVNKALKLNPDYAPAYFALAINYEIMGKIKKAKQMYRKTLKLKPGIRTAKDRLDSLSSKNAN